MQADFFCYTVFIMEGEHASLNKTNQVQYKETQTSFLIRVFFVILLASIVVVGIVIGIIRNQKYLFSSVSVVGVNTFHSEDIVEFTHSYWNGTYLGVIPRSSTILFSKDRFQKQLIQKFPIIDMAYITLPTPDVLQINIKERTPAIVWCFAENSCGFVDSSGILYGTAPEFSEGVYPIFQSESNNNLQEKMGTEIIEPNTMKRFISLFNNLQSDTMNLSKTYFYTDGDVAFSIDTLFGVYTKNAAKLLGTVGQDDELFIRDLKTGLNNDAFKKQFLENPKTLEYIDMRFKGKIFYKFTTSAKPMEKESEPNSD